jgi:hypothetical protein
MRKTISPQLLKPRPQELGRIKIGGKGQERTGKGGKTWNAPEKYDHFVVTTRRRDGANFERDSHIHSIVGDAPTELDVRLGYDSIEDNWQSSMVVYDGKLRVSTCDGEECVEHATGLVTPCGSPSCGCKPYGRLLVLLQHSPTFGNFYGFRSTGWESIGNLQGSLEWLSKLSGGALSTLPLKLVMYPSTSQHGTHYSVGLLLAVRMEEAMQLATESARTIIGQRRTLKALTAGEEPGAEVPDEPEEDEGFAEEFFPAPEPTVQPGAPGGPERDLAGSDQLRRLQGQYHALLDDMLGSAKEDWRHAYQYADPEVPSTTSEWTASDYMDAIAKIERYGEALFRKGVTRLYEQDPASEAERALLLQLAENTDMGFEERAHLHRVHQDKVGVWVRREIQRLQLRAVAAP